jgi:phosphate:Na+ symporter
MVPLLLGGVGLFLLGMTLMTDGLKVLAGDALQRVLVRFTGGPTRAMASGAALTALVQSSSATTLATIGFVSAGLLTFPQALGVILGANLGTTSTAWLVSLLGLKLSVSAIALPLVGLGALGRLLGRDRWAALGTAIAGFGLVFVGIDTLQAGMADLSSRIEPASLPGASLGGRLALVGIGAVMTFVMQSSSAAVATTLAGVHAGTIGLEQAAALVIGQNIGTTITAGIAAIGASIAARRTAVAHVMFNVLTGLIALALLPVFVELVAWLVDDGDPAVTLAGFHTAFNLLGVALFLPFTARFAEFIERVVRDRHPAAIRHLDATVSQIPGVAVEAARRSLIEIAHDLIAVTRDVAAPTPPSREVLADRCARASESLRVTQAFLGRLRTQSESPETHARHLSNLHAIDHLATLANESLRAPNSRSDEIALAPTAAMRTVLDPVEAWLADPSGSAPLAIVEEAAMSVRAQVREQRAATLGRAASGELDPALALAGLERMAWIDRVAHHAWRALAHLAPEPRPTASHESGAFPVAN